MPTLEQPIENHGGTKEMANELIDSELLDTS